MTLTVKDSLERLQHNEERIDQFVNDPEQAGTYTTRAGEQVPTIPALIEEIRLAASALGQPDGAARVGYQPAEGEATTVQATLRLLELSVSLLAQLPTATQAVAQHELKANPHPQYAPSTHTHGQYITRAKLHAAALLF